jgi:hypothetical protein
MQLVLSQEAIRLALLPVNLIVLVISVTIVAYLNSHVPNYMFSDFVFWLLKPAIKIQIMLTAIILVVGFVGNIRYNKCWQGSYAFFVFLLTAIYATSYYFSVDLLHSAETIIPKLDKAGAYFFERLEAFKEIGVLKWEPSECNCNDNISLNTCESDAEYHKLFVNIYHKSCNELKDSPNYAYSDVGAKDYILKSIKALPPVFKKWELVGTIVIGAYDLYLFIFFILVSESTQYQAEEKAVQGN